MGILTKLVSWYVHPMGGNLIHKEKRLVVPLVLLCMVVSSFTAYVCYAAYWVFSVLQTVMDYGELTACFITMCILLLQSALLCYFLANNISKKRDEMLFKRLATAFIEGFYSK